MSFAPPIVSIGQLLNVSITVRNNSSQTLTTVEPDPGFVYDEGDTFAARGFPATANAFRVGVDFDARAGTVVDHPYRWGLGAPLASGQTATLTGAIRLKTPRAAKYWAGLVREQIAWVQDRQGVQQITVTPPPRPEPIFTAGASAINAGQSVTLTWNAPSASSVLLNGQTVVAQGTQTVTPTQTTTYTLHIVFPDNTTKDLNVAVTVAAAPLPPSFVWDARLDTLGVNVTRANASPAWHLTSALYQNENASSLNHNVYFTLQKNDGTPAAGVPVVVDWVGRDASDAPAQATTDANSQANIPIWAVMHAELKDGAYFAFVKNAPSDRVNGMGLPAARHVNFLLTFKLG